MGMGVLACHAGVALGADHTKRLPTNCIDAFGCTLGGVANEKTTQPGGGARLTIVLMAVGRWK